ncbi:MAG: TatD family hydrolase [Thioalkalivibrionaceae bacterium]
MAACVGGQVGRGWIDFHIHLDFPAFDDDREAVVSAAIAAGVEDFIVPAVTRERWSRLASLSSRFGWHPAYGLHPCFGQHHHPSDVEALEAWLDDHPEAIAVGEIGLDGARPDQAEQAKRLTAQLAIARQYGLPVILHAHRALETVLLHLREHVRAGGVGGVVHAFSGSDVQLDRLLDLGFSIGVGGPVTYPRAARLRRQVARVPADRLLLETDAPDQPLRGHQGQRNVPAQVAKVAAVVAALRDEPEASLMTAQRLNLAALGDGRHHRQTRA